MCIKTNNSEATYCHGCDFHCKLGARRKLFSFPAKYYPTINCRTTPEKITAKSYKEAQQWANTLTQSCARYQK
jgi:hypothetical protein